MTTTAYTMQDVEKIKAKLLLTIKELPLLTAGLPPHISYTAVLGALFEQAMRSDEKEAVAVTKKLVDKVIKHVSIVNQSIVSKYQKVYNKIIETILTNHKNSVETTIEDTKTEDIKTLENFNACMNSLAVVTPSAMTSYFDKVFAGETEFLVLEVPTHSKLQIAYLPSEESANRVTLLSLFLAGLPAQSIDISLVYTYASTCIIRGGYEDNEFIDRINMSFFDAISNGFLASKVLSYFSPMMEREFEEMSKSFFF